MEEKGYRCEVWTTISSNPYKSNFSRQFIGAICLKKPSDPLDVSTLVNAVSGWTLRTMWFALFHSLLKEDCKSSYGGYMPIHPSDMKEITQDDEVVYSSGTFSYNGALAVIESEIKKHMKQ
jgi:hypothetical protein